MAYGDYWGPEVWRRIQLQRVQDHGLGFKLEGCGGQITPVSTEAALRATNPLHNTRFGPEDCMFFARPHSFLIPTRSAAVCLNFESGKSLCYVGWMPKGCLLAFLLARPDALVLTNSSQIKRTKTLSGCGLAAQCPSRCSCDYLHMLPETVARPKAQEAGNACTSAGYGSTVKSTNKVAIPTGCHRSRFAECLPP